MGILSDIRQIRLMSQKWVIPRRIPKSKNVRPDVLPRMAFSEIATGEAINNPTMARMYEYSLYVDDGLMTIRFHLRFDSLVYQLRSTRT